MIDTHDLYCISYRRHISRCHRSTTFVMGEARVTATTTAAATTTIEMTPSRLEPHVRSHSYNKTPIRTSTRHNYGVDGLTGSQRRRPRPRPTATVAPAARTTRSATRCASRPRRPSRPRRSCCRRLACSSSTSGRTTERYASAREM